MSGEERVKKNKNVTRPLMKCTRGSYTISSSHYILRKSSTSTGETCQANHLPLGTALNATPAAHDGSTPLVMGVPRINLEGRQGVA